MMQVAGVHPASTRLGVGLLGLIVFGALATTKRRRPIAAIPVTGLCLIAADWLFGATLVWGTGYATKVRWVRRLDLQRRRVAMDRLLVLATCGELPWASHYAHSRVTSSVKADWCGFAVLRGQASAVQRDDDRSRQPKEAGGSDTASDNDRRRLRVKPHCPRLAGPRSRGASCVPLLGG